MTGARAEAGFESLGTRPIYRRAFTLVVDCSLLHVPRPDEFFAIDIRVGTIIEAMPFPEALKPAIKLAIDFGPSIGVKRSSAQLTMHYTPESLLGRQVIAVTNIGSRRIAGFTSEVLVLGAMPSAIEVILLGADDAVPNGTRIG